MMTCGKRSEVVRCFATKRATKRTGKLESARVLVSASCPGDMAPRHVDVDGVVDSEGYLVPAKTGVGDE